LIEAQSRYSEAGAVTDLVKEWSTSKEKINSSRLFKSVLLPALTVRVTRTCLHHQPLLSERLPENTFFVSLFVSFYETTLVMQFKPQDFLSPEKMKLKF